ncbi:MAG: 5'-nucleotidase C-terminal domain-containing protein [Oscillospiraceae bacterium]|jgi:2',3'-cyclic-nucleotide 2'-phosphodiesterase (5'-nucleotidase family)
MKPRRREALIKAAGMLAAVIIAVLTSGAYQPGDVVGVMPVVLDSLLESEPGSAGCELGCFAADAARYFSGADFAIVNGGDLVRDLNQGKVLWEDVEAVFAEERALAVAEITPAELKEILEESVRHIALDPVTEFIDREHSDYPGFAQVSGFSFVFDASAPAGERIFSISLPDGNGLDITDDKTLYTLAASEYMLSGGYGYESVGGHTPLNATLADALAKYVAESPEAIADGDYTRIEAIGCADDTIVLHISKPVIVLGVIVLMIVISMFIRRRPKQNEKAPR